jgi:integrase
VIKKNETVKKPTISDRTVNRHLSALGAFCDWLVLRRLLDRNPVAGLQQPLDRNKHSMLPFTVDQMNILFASPLFTGCQSAEAPRFWAKPGNVMIRDYRYWVPLIMLYSGVRAGEIAQLAVSDIRQEQGVWIFHISDEGKDSPSAKTGVTRAVPVHRELVALGFIKHVERLKAAGEARLFPGAMPNQRGQMIADFEKNFGLYLTRLRIKRGRGVSLYSFRRNAADALRRAGYRDEQFGFMLGHASASIATHYSVLPEGMLGWRVDLVNSIEYPGLDLSGLRPENS